MDANDTLDAGSDSRPDAGERALVLASGGIDSAVALAWAVEQGLAVRALTFDYHRRPDAERRAVAAQLDALGLPDALRVDLPWMREVEDMDPRPAALDDAPGSYVPARNAIFYAIAAHHAERLDARVLVGGHNGGDGDDFPDATAAWFADLEPLLNRGLHSAGRDGGGGERLRILLPLKDRTKADVVRPGARLGVPFDRTWSCAYDGDLHCGTCTSCRERRDAFEEAGVEDPAAYEATRAAEPAEVPP